MLIAKTRQHISNESALICYRRPPNSEDLATEEELTFNFLILKS